MEADVSSSLELSQKLHAVQAGGLGVLVRKSYIDSAELLDTRVTT